MPRSTNHKRKTRERIMASAAQQLREHGYNGVSIESLMGAANLTRGGFYAHFSSKQDLFTHIVREEHPLLRRLEAREGDEPEALWQQMMVIFDGYLHPDHLTQIAHACTLVALSGDVSRAPAIVQEAYEDAMNRIQSEMVRGHEIDPQHPDLVNALVLAVGAVSMASASSSEQKREIILNSAHAQFSILMRELSTTGGRHDNRI